MAALISIALFIYTGMVYVVLFVAFGSDFASVYAIPISLISLFAIFGIAVIISDLHDLLTGREELAS